MMKTSIDTCFNVNIFSILYVVLHFCPVSQIFIRKCLNEDSVMILALLCEKEHKMYSCAFHQKRDTVAEYVTLFIDACN